MSTTKKIALVTGASRGIGRATAKALAADGVHVIAHYGSSRAEAESLVEEIRKAGGTADIVGADLAAVDGAQKLAADVKSLVEGKLDIVVANAGIAKAADIEGYTTDDFDALFAVNVRSPYFLLQQLLPMLGEGASVIFLSSLAARSSVGALSAYAATKGAIDTIVKHVATALGPKGIRVNAVAPGVIETEMSSFAQTPEGRAMTLGMQALQRVGQAEDVADVIAFLASDKSRWIDGVIIPVDGGSKL